ncbi:S41 family peptidase [Ulvibacterium marinum]|uniref:Peptidase S41 n=1 Tax=Ulvibacterium marinum TaxID=2419782 RepID=A0A3B0C7K9_9FLAO|nr:S41 family peptidase [Ulvibacterium marinum]RKN79407.1 peptidase S41 [Ulvibacterium marinum]
MKKILFLFLLATVLSCNSQQKDLEKEQGKFSKIYAQKQYLDDIEELSEKLISTHPQPFEFISKENFFKVVEEKKNAITDKTTFGEFIWHTSEIVANIGCSHTNLGAFIQESEILPVDKIFPLEIRMIEGKMYISNSLINKEKKLEGSEILNINGVSAKSIKDDIYKHISADGGDGRESKKKYFNFFSPYYISYSLNFPENYEVKIAGIKEPIILNKLKEYEFTYEGKEDYSKEYCEDVLCFRTIDDKSTSILTMRTFYYDGEDLLKYRQLLEKSFKELKEKGIKNLIIDLRGNGGGQSFNGAHLLRYLSSETFTYFLRNEYADEEQFNPMNPFENQFEGNIYILQNAGCGSTTGHFLSLVKSNNIATLIGEESGGTYTCNDYSFSLELKNTGITTRIARSTFTTTAENLPKDKGIVPDHNVVQSIQDFLRGQDTVMEYTFDLINAEKN